MVLSLMLFQSIEFQLSLLIAVALIAFFFARTFKFSVVIAEIIVGAIFGPSVLNLITYTEFIKDLAAMGAIFLLFVVGLQTKFKEIVTPKAFFVAFLGIVIPWVSGYYVALFFGFEFIAAVFVGTALTATSIAITAQVLRELKKIDTETAKTIIGAAVIDDVLSLMALSITTQFATGEIRIAGVANALVIAVVFLVGGFFIGSIFIAKQLERLNKWEEKHEAHAMTFLAAIAIAFVYSAVAEAIGLSAIVGAFLAGVSLENVKIRSYREGTEYLEMVFGSIFFVSLGVLIDLRQGFPVVFVLVLTLVAVLSKVAGGFAGARLFGVKARDALGVGIGMIPRGEIALIIALLGLNAGIVGQAVYSSIVIVSFLTTLLTPTLLKPILSSKTA